MTLNPTKSPVAFPPLVGAQTMLASGITACDNPAMSPRQRFHLRQAALGVLLVVLTVRLWLIDRAQRAQPVPEPPDLPRHSGLTAPEDAVADAVLSEFSDAQFLQWQYASAVEVQTWPACKDKATWIVRVKFETDGDILDCLYAVDGKEVNFIQHNDDGEGWKAAMSVKLP